LWRPKTNHEPGLAAVKHAQGVAERAAARTPPILRRPSGF
jgi:hypothetical protein